MSIVSFLRKLGSCFLICALSTTAAYAQFSVLYTYGSNPDDPVDPQSNTAIAQGRDGNLYSTAIQGGANGYGAAFMITPSGALTVLYSFCSLPACADGLRPSGGLTLGTDGNFYGTTSGGGNTDNGYGDGVVFNMTSGGALTVLHVFTAATDGNFPYAAPVEGLDGNFYGTTSVGGSGGCGTIYKVTPSGTFTVLHTFPNSSTDGCAPHASLVLGTDGNLYGTASYGAYSTFKITPLGKYTHLTSSSALAGGYAPLMQAPNGSFYGSNGGQIFRMTSSGAVSILHTSGGTTDPNGSGYNSGVAWASDGNLYGDSTSGGTTTNCSSNLGYCGVIFKMTTGGAYTDLFDFEDADGFEGTPVIQNTNGIIYGQTDFGGVISGNLINAGTFWSWNNGLKPFVSFMPFTGHVGDQIQIFGQGFTDSSVVKFSGVTATETTLTGPTFILATVPAGTLDGYITVTTGTTTLKSLYKFLVHDSWGAGTPMPTAAVASCAAVLSGQVYVVGGVNSSPLTNNQIYNPSTNKWSSGTALGTGLSNQACAGVNGEVYEFGGTNNIGSSQTNAVWAYNPSTKVWTSKTAMPAALQDIVAVVDKGLVYVIGGYNGNRVTTVEAYNPATDTWTSEASLLVAQSGDAAGLIGSTIVISGGAGQSTDTGDTESYSVTKNSWTSRTADSTLRNNPCGGSIGTSLYVAGGEDRTTPPALNVLRAFAPSSNTWTTLSSIPQGTVDPASAVFNEQLYCFGGWTAFEGTVLNNVQIYQP